MSDDSYSEEEWDHMQAAAMLMLLQHKQDEDSTIAIRTTTEGTGVIICYTADVLARLETWVLQQKAADEWQDATQDMPDA